jgi:lipoic acid synthetase
MRKPYWLNKKIHFSQCREVKETLRRLDIHSVCEQALCPNMSDCFSNGVATFLILGNICTRDCSFCAISRGIPRKPNLSQPQKITQAVKTLKLRYVVITSPTRDDLKDAGAEMFCQVVKKIKDFDSFIKVEVLIPDFLGSRSLLKKVVSVKPDIISHNLETVSSLYAKVRQGAGYQRSLGVLKTIKEINPKIHTKSGLMLGLGEKDQEIIEALKDLRKTGCEFLTLGQYLAPSRKHYPVKTFITPEKFQYFAKKAYNLGFKTVKSSPYSRSSYLAHEFLV